MADKLTKAELEDLKAQGYVEGNINSFPDNVSPVLREKALAAWKDAQDHDVTAEELPTAVDRQNQRERERAALDGDKDMQKVTGVKPDADPLDHDGNGVKGGAKRQSDVNKG